MRGESPRGGRAPRGARSTLTMRPHYLTGVSLLPIVCLTTEDLASAPGSTARGSAGQHRSPGSAAQTTGGAPSPPPVQQVPTASPRAKHSLFGHRGTMRTPSLASRWELELEHSSLPQQAKDQNLTRSYTPRSLKTFNAKQEEWDSITPADPGSILWWVDSACPRNNVGFGM